MQQFSLPKEITCEIHNKPVIALNITKQCQSSRLVCTDCNSIEQKIIFLTQIEQLLLQDQEGIQQILISQIKQFRSQIQSIQTNLKEMEEIFIQETDLIKKNSQTIQYIQKFSDPDFCNKNECISLFQELGEYISQERRKILKKQKIFKFNNLEIMTNKISYMNQELNDLQQESQQRLGPQQRNIHSDEYYQQFEFDTESKPIVKQEIQDQTLISTKDLNRAQLQQNIVINAIAISNDENSYAICQLQEGKSLIKIFDLQTGQQIKCFDSLFFSTQSLYFSIHDKYLVCNGLNNLSIIKLQCPDNSDQIQIVSKQIPKKVKFSQINEDIIYFIESTYIAIYNLNNNSMENKIQGQKRLQITQYCFDEKEFVYFIQNKNINCQSVINEKKKWKCDDVDQIDKIVEMQIINGSSILLIYKDTIELGNLNFLDKQLQFKKIRSINPNFNSIITQVQFIISTDVKYIASYCQTNIILIIEVSTGLQKRKIETQFGDNIQKIALSSKMNFFITYNGHDIDIWGNKRQKQNVNNNDNKNIIQASNSKCCQIF